MKPNAPPPQLVMNPVRRPRARNLKKNCATSNIRSAIASPLLTTRPAVFLCRPITLRSAPSSFDTYVVTGRLTPRLSHMGSTSREPRDATTASVANPVVRPPLVVLASLVAGGMLNVFWPLPFVPRALRLPVGCLLVALAAALFSSAIRQFRMAGTPVPGNEPTTAIVRAGPYRFSRNPIYLAFFALHLGLAIWVNSMWLAATLVTTIAIIAVVVVPREERYLTVRFGREYLEYKASVRRWL